jgi:predicted transcriptional regulator
MQQAAGLEALITFNPWTLTPQTTLAEAVRLVADTGICGWPVVDQEGKLVGLLGDAELGAALAQDASLDRAVSSAMQHDPHWVESTASFHSALEKLLQASARLLPVIDQGCVVGTLTPTDFLRELSYGSGRLASELVVDLMQRTTEGIDADLTLSAGTIQLHSSGVVVLPVMQGDFTLGAVTRRSLMRMRMRMGARPTDDEGPSDPTLGHLLQSSPILAPGRTVGEAAAVMVQYNIDALAVANQAAHLLGVITDDLILQALWNA